MPGNYSHTTRADGTVLTAAIYNQDHQNHINNMTPAGVDDYSADVTEMRVTTDPGETGSESYATSLAGELARLRFAVQDIKTYLGLQGSYWYNSPSGLITPALVNDHSANVGQMQATTNPGSTGSESLATDLRGEIERLRYCIKQIKDTMNPVTNWYDPATFSPVGPAGAYVRGLVGSASGTTATLAADELLVRTTSGSHTWLTNTGNKTCDISVHGVNGRDTAAAFPNSQWVYVYFIWNGTTISTVASLSGLPAGPTLPSGYTHFALATVLLMNGTNFRTSYFQGRRVTWVDLYTLTVDTTAQNYTSTSAPYTGGLESLQFYLALEASPNSGASDIILTISPTNSGGSNSVRVYATRYVAQDISVASYDRQQVDVVAKDTYYRSLSISGSVSVTATVGLSGYTVQNGA